MPRWRLLRVIAHDPKLVLNMLKRALPETKEWNIGYLGQIEGADFAGIDSLSWRFFSFATWVQSLPLKVFMWLYVLLALPGYMRR